MSTHTHLHTPHNSTAIIVILIWRATTGKEDDQAFSDRMFSF